MHEFFVRLTDALTIMTHIVLNIIKYKARPLGAPQFVHSWEKKTSATGRYRVIRVKTKAPPDKHCKTTHDVLSGSAFIIVQPEPGLLFPGFFRLLVPDRSGKSGDRIREFSGFLRLRVVSFHLLKL